MCLNKAATTVFTQLFSLISSNDSSALTTTLFRTQFSLLTKTRTNVASRQFSFSFRLKLTSKA